MLTILLPAWAGWSLALLVVATWLGVWALCRAAALGDEMMLILEGPVESEAASAAGDQALEPVSALERPEAYTTSEAGFLGDSPCSREEELLTISG
jgi:hypothetical protein